MNKRYALLVACDQYNDPSWHRLLAPLRDAEALAEVLQAEQSGGFSVEMCLNKTRAEVEEAIEQVCGKCESGDMLLLYFSCHGEKDPQDELLFTLTGTRRTALRSTSLPASELQSHLIRCKARQQILLLDCCYSGAFGETMRHKGTSSQSVGVNTGKYFMPNLGKGLCVVSATDSIQLGYERNGQSQFTKFIVEGLKSGDADGDRDGLITIDELYDYVHEKLSKERCPQSPVKEQMHVQGKLIVGYAPQNARPRRSRKRNTGPQVEAVSSPATVPISSACPSSPALPQTQECVASDHASSQSVPPVPASSITPHSPRIRHNRYAWAGLLLVLACGGFAGGRYLMASQRNESATPVPSLPQAMAASKLELATPAPEGLQPAEDKTPFQPAPAPPTMARVKAGRYRLGSFDRTAQNPVHEAVLSFFEIDLTEVTVSAYEACVHKRSCSSPLAGRSGSYCNWTVSGRGNHPINCVTFQQAEQYCRWVGKRLPSADEWELAARGEDGGPYPWGNDPPTAERANTCGTGCKSGRIEQDGELTTAEVGRYPSGRSPFGLQDVAGNVWEWVTTTAALPANRRMALGGSWQSPSPIHFRSDRRHTEQNGQWGHTGFRCAR